MGRLGIAVVTDTRFVSHAGCWSCLLLSWSTTRLDAAGGGEGAETDRRPGPLVRTVIRLLSPGGGGPQQSLSFLSAPSVLVQCCWPTLSFRDGMLPSLIADRLDFWFVVWSSARAARTCRFCAAASSCCVLYFLPACPAARDVTDTVLRVVATFFLAVLLPYPRAPPAGLFCFGAPLFFSPRPPPAASFNATSRLDRPPSLGGAEEWGYVLGGPGVH